MRYRATSAAGRTFYRPHPGATDQANREAARAEHLARIGPDGRIVWEHGTRNRRALRIPNWLSAADRRAIRKMYALARRLTRETGIEHHVDHEWPLLGYYVSGLHVPDNLQVITAATNMEKGNQFPRGATVNPSEQQKLNFRP